MSEQVEIWKAMEELRKQEGEQRRQLAHSQLKEAQTLLRGTRIKLSPMGQGYRFESSDYMIDVYPGNQRIYAPNPKKRGPWLNLPEEWTLLDVSRALLDAKAKQ